MQASATQLLAGSRPKPTPHWAHRQPPGSVACSSLADSSSRAVAPRHAEQRRRQAVTAAAAADVDIYGEPIGENEIGIIDKDVYVEGMPDGIEGRAGYTPYDFIDFTDIPLKHEVVVKVDKPVSEVYALWSDRLNWPDWFTMIDEVGFREDDEDVCALNMWYRFAMTPWLELYVALRRTKAEPNKYIVEEPEDGAPIVAAALFQEDGGSTLVTLRVSYLLPRVLYQFAGQVAVYGDVDRKLARCMENMKEWVEAADFEEAAAAGAAAMAEIRAGMPEHQRQQAMANARWEAEKQRFEQQEQQQEVAAEAAAAQSAAAADLEAAAAQARAAAVPLREAAADAEAGAPRARRARKATGGGSGSGAVVTNPMAKRRGRKAADAGA